MRWAARSERGACVKAAREKSPTSERSGNLFKYARTRT
jgi:hypothetical protein